MGCHFLLQRIFGTQGSNSGLAHCRQTLYNLSHKGQNSSCFKTNHIILTHFLCHRCSYSINNVNNINLTKYKMKRNIFVVKSQSRILGVNREVRISLIENWFCKSITISGLPWGPQSVKNSPAMQETGVQSLVGKIPWKRAGQPTPVFLPGQSPWTEEPGGLQSMGFQTETGLSN